MSTDCSNKPKWRRYEQQIAYKFILENSWIATVAHDLAWLNSDGSRQQMDIFLLGGLVMVPVECKHHSSPVGPRIINEFIGKLLDAGCHYGILVSSSGFTPEGHRRADRSDDPKIDLLHVPFCQCVDDVAGRRLQNLSCEAATCRAAIRIADPSQDQNLASKVNVPMDATVQMFISWRPSGRRPYAQFSGRTNRAAKE